VGLALADSGRGEGAQDAGVRDQALRGQGDDVLDFAGGGQAEQQHVAVDPGVAHAPDVVETRVRDRRHAAGEDRAHDTGVAAYGLRDRRDGDAVPRAELHCGAGIDGDLVEVGDDPHIQKP